MALDSLSPVEKAEAVQKATDLQAVVWEKEVVPDDPYGNIKSKADGESFEFKMLEAFCLHSYNCWTGNCQIGEALELLHPGIKKDLRPCRRMFRDEKILGTVRAGPMLDQIKVTNQ